MGEWDVTETAQSYNVDAGSQTRYLLGDHLGSISMELSEAGWPTSSTTLYPYGQAIADNSVTHYKFTGKERDAESGLDYFGARYMSSTMGRFMSPDYSDDPVPIPYAKLDNPQSLNLYAYVGNNPLSYVDEDGHDGALPQATCGNNPLCILAQLLRHLFSGNGNGTSNGGNGNGSNNGGNNGNGNGDAFGGISPIQGRQIINNARSYQDVPYSQNVSKSSPDNKPRKYSD